MRYLKYLPFAVLVVLGGIQAVCTVSALTGDVSNRIELMGVFLLSPWTILAVAILLELFLFALG
jgi:hypothetical protein